MIRAAVLGFPINHSLSPLLHNKAYQILGVEASYGAIELKPEGAFDFFNNLSRSDWTGFSLTMPLKEAIISLGEKLGYSLDPEAKRALSGNTLVRVGETFHVTSTDRSAFIRLLSDLPCDRVAIIGGGGTARAALSSLVGKARHVDFLLRTASRSEVLMAIADDVELGFYGMEHSLDGYDLIISTVPAGASDQIAARLHSPVPYFFEVLYNPYPTQLLAKMRSQRSVTFDGIDLLVEQALDQIALFSGVEFSYDTMRRELQESARNSVR
jgi:shikimate dehydrogenase